MAYTFATMPYDLKISTLKIDNGGSGKDIKTIYNAVPEWVADDTIFVTELSEQEMHEIMGFPLTLEVGGDKYELTWNADGMEWTSDTSMLCELYYNEDIGSLAFYFENEGGDAHGEQYIGKTFKITYDANADRVITLYSGNVVFESAQRGEISRGTMEAFSTDYNGEECTVTINAVTRDDTQVSLDEGMITLDVFDDAALALSGEAYYVSISYIQAGGGGGIVPEGTYHVTENGTYDITEYAKVDVNVPEPTGTISITQNGNGIDVSAYEYANVNVSGGGGSAFTGSVTITIAGDTPGQLTSITYVDDTGAHSDTASLGSPLTIHAPLTYYSGVGANQVHTFFKIDGAIDSALRPFTISGFPAGMKINAAVTGTYASVANQTLVEITGGADIGDVSNVQITITYSSGK